MLEQLDMDRPISNQNITLIKKSHPQIAQWNSSHAEPVAGQTYNEWTIVGNYRKPNWSYKDKVMCRCSCGVHRPVHIGNVVYGLSKSCGHSQYDVNREAIAKRKDVYENRIGEIFDEFTLQRLHREGESFHFTLTCPNGHDMKIRTQNTPSQHVKSKGFGCWCQIKDPVDRMRNRKGLTLQQVGDKLGRTRERIRQYEVQTKELKALERKRHGQSNEEMLNDHNAFNMLATAYELSERERYMWIDEILYKRFYEYDEPKRQDFMK